MYEPAAPYPAQGGYLPPQGARMGYSPVYAPQQRQEQILCRPVASLEEARAIPTDFSGALLLLPDLTHGMIYTKQLNFADGTAVFRQYQAVQEAPAAPVYASADTVEELRGQLAEVRGELAQLSAAYAAQQEKQKPARGGAEK